MSNRAIPVTVVFSLTVVLSGCQSDGGFHAFQQSVEITGAVIKESSSGKHTAVDLREIRINEKGHTIPIPTNKLIVTPIILEVEMKTFDFAFDQSFTALIGPRAPSNTAEFRVLNSPDLKFYVASGWAFFWGRWPIIRTQYVLIGPESTTIITEKDGDIDRIFYVQDSSSGSKFELECVDPAGTTLSAFTTISPGEYVEVKYDTTTKKCELLNGTPKPYAGTTYATYVRDSQDLAELAGYED